MIVTCESCKTKFRIDPARLKRPMNKVRCSQCGSIFTVERPSETAPQASEENLLVQMDLPDETASTDEDDLFIERDRPIPEVALEPRQSNRLKTALFWGLPLIVFLAGSVWYVNFHNPSPPASQQSASTGPGETEQATVNILDSTKAYFLENSKAGQIFVVEGEAVNESKKPVSFILLEGKLYTTNNQVAQSQKAFCGNVMTRDELRQLAVTEIQDRMMNREGKNLSDVHVKLGARVPFMLVFHNLPDLNLLNDYSVEVISTKVE